MMTDGSESRPYQRNDGRRVGGRGLYQWTKHVDRATWLQGLGKNRKRWRAGRAPYKSMAGKIS